MKKTVGELEVVKSRLNQENTDLGKQLEDQESKVGSLSKVKKNYEQQIEDLKKTLDEEARVGIAVLFGDANSLQQ